MLVTILHHFADMVLAPAGLLPRHARSMTLLHHLQKVLLCEDPGRLCPQEVFATNREHHELFLSLYPGCSKPKLHYVWHCLQCHLEFGVKLNCFGSERKHRFSKRLGGFCYNLMTTTFLTRSAKAMLEDLATSVHLTRFCLLPPCRRVLAGQEGLALGVAPGEGYASSRHMRGPFGHLAHDQLVRWRPNRESPVVCVGELKRCLELQGSVFLLLVRKCSPGPGGIWLRGRGACLVHVDHLFETPCWISEPNGWLVPC